MKSIMSHKEKYIYSKHFFVFEEEIFQNSKVRINKKYLNDIIKTIFSFQPFNMMNLIR